MYLAPRRQRHVLPWHAAWQKIARFNDYGEPIGAPSTSAVWVLQRSTAIPNNGFYRFHRVLQGQKTGSTGTRNGKITRIFMNIMFWSFFYDPKGF